MTEKYNLEELFQVHIKTLNNIEVLNDKFLVAFSGPPGCGKTTISKVIETELNGIRFSSDEVRELIRQTYALTKDGDVNNLLLEYIAYFIIQVLNYNNKFIIIDASIDRQYETFIKLSEKYSYPYYIVNMGIPKEEVIKRITSRNREDKEGMLNVIDKYFEDYEKNKFIIKPNFVITADMGYPYKDLLISLRAALLNE